MKKKEAEKAKPKTRELSVQAIKTDVLRLGENLFSFLEKSLTDKEAPLLEGRVLAITSKIVSLSENRVVPKSQISKEDLVRREADFYLSEINYGIHLTIKEGLVIPSAGIDESNAEAEFYILYPEKPFYSAELIWTFLKQHFKLKKLGVILTDSHTTPLRRGVTGVALSYWGFKGVTSQVGVSDLFGKPLKFTHINVVDALATAAVLTMGEAQESCPLALLKDSQLEFTDKTEPTELRIPREEDLYRPWLS